MKTTGNKLFEDIKQWIRGAAEKIMLFLPDGLTGDQTTMQQKYKKMYGQKEVENLIRQEKVKITICYLTLTACYLAILIGACISQLDHGELATVRRPERGEGMANIPMEVRMNYNGYAMTKRVTLKVSEKALSEKEKLQCLSQFKTDLASLVLGENKDLNHISSPMRLVDRDEKTGILVSWTSDHPEIIDEKGFVDLLEAKDNQMVRLKAEMTLDDITENHTFTIRVDTSAPEEDYNRSLESRLNSMLDQLSERGSSANLRLPNQIGGVQIRWSSVSGSNLTAFTILFLFLGGIIYLKRFDQIDREWREAEESIISDLPEFMNKLVLLLNAGLVVSSAFSKIAEDYKQFHASQSGHKKRYLYEELCEIQSRTERTNTSIVSELKEFSQRSGVRELIRLTAIIADNWDKGSMLSDKLEGESELLWTSRKKRAEERGRLAETKLTFPLMILLIVLIMITIAPALMEM